MRLGEDPSRVVYAAVAELADALDSKSSGSPRAGSSPASGIEHSRKKSRKLLFSGSSGLFCFRGETGYTNGAYGADAAYLGTSGGKVKFMLSGVVGWAAEGDVQVVDLSSAASVSHYKVSNGRLIHYISQNMNLSSALSSLDNGPAPAFLEQGVTYYSYDGHYFYSDYMTMLQDYQNGSRGNSVNPDAPYYNYFQYLPFRSRTGYSADSLNSIINGKVSASSKLRDTGSVMVKYQDAYGVNALLMAGVAANESAWGTSSICMNKNNLFGLNAVDSSPGTSADTYASVEECIRQFAAGYMSGKYLNPNDWRYFGGFLGNKASGINVKYASDPYWGEKAANIAWTLDRLGGSTDSQVYTLGVKGTDAADYTSVNVRSAGNTSSKILYRTGTQPAYSVLTGTVCLLAWQTCSPATEAFRTGHTKRPMPDFSPWNSRGQGSSATTSPDTPACSENVQTGRWGFSSEAVPPSRTFFRMTGYLWQS